MKKYLVIVFLISAAIPLVVGHPADHREDTVLPFSLSPGNVNLETYYLDKYPQPGVPGGALAKQPTSQMTPSPLDPVPVPDANGNMFYIHKTEDPHAMFRSRREALAQFGGGHQYPNGGHNHGMSYGLYDEDNLHLHNYPRNGYPSQERHQQPSQHFPNHVTSHSQHHHQHHNAPPHHHQHHNHGRY